MTIEVILFNETLYKTIQVGIGSEVSGMTSFLVKITLSVTAFGDPCGPDQLRCSED